MLTELARWVKGVAKLDARVCRENFLCYRGHRAWSMGHGERHCGFRISKLATDYWLPTT